MKNSHIARFISQDEVLNQTITKYPKRDGLRNYVLIKGVTVSGGEQVNLAIEYPADQWPTAVARTHSKAAGAISFEPAEGDGIDEGAFTKTWIDEIKGDALSAVKDRSAELESYGLCSGDECVDLAKLSADLDRRHGFDCHAEIILAKGPSSDRRIAGYANTKNIDRYNEIIDPKAFKSSLKRWKKDGVILLDHDSRKPIGFPGPGTKIDKEGLWLDGIIVDDDVDADYAWGKIVKRLKKAFSVGFRILKAEWKKIEGYKDEIRVITDLDLYEVSVVTIPANIQSTFDLVKGIVHGSDLYDPALKSWLLPADHAGTQLLGVHGPQQTEDESREYAHTIDFVRRINRDLESKSKEAELLARLRRLNERFEVR